VRQSAVIRITHWLNALAIIVMIGSGWRIHNQEPLLASSSGMDNVGRRAPNLSSYNAFYPEDQAPVLDPATYKLELSGSIGDKRPWTLDQLYQLPRTSQITRHVCVEGWSRIGKWSGCLLRVFLERVAARSHGQVCWLHLRRRVLHQHRHADCAAPSDDHGIYLCRRGTSAQIWLSDENPDSDEARLQEPEIRHRAQRDE
jgi:hypothetical protein